MQLSLNCVVHDDDADEEIYVDVVGVNVKKKSYMNHYPGVTVKTKTILLRIETRDQKYEALYILSDVSM
jgi:hypothetical protein